MADKERLDLLLAERGLAESREQARRLIMAGKVTSGTRVLSKPGVRIARDTDLAVAAPAPYVSRGGEKLAAALRFFDIRPHGLTCLDVGASTGGFTDCLLQNGAATVYAVDVGRGQLHSRIRGDPRVVVREKCNARNLRPADFPGAAIMLAALDVSFISLTKILPAVTGVLQPGACLVCLIKPQFEAGRREVSKGGVVRDETVRAATVEKIRLFVTSALGLEWTGVCESPLRGPAGNVEFLACCRKSL